MLEYQEKVSFLQQSTENHLVATRLLRDEYRRIKKEYDDVVIIVEQQKAILSLSEHRNKLLPQSPCPLCGSQDHPYVESDNNDAPILSANDEYQKRMLALESHLKSIEQQGIAANEQNTQVTTEKSLITQNIQQLLVEEQNLFMQWEERNENTKSQCQLNDVNVIQIEIENNQNHLELLIKENHRIRQLTALIDKASIQGNHDEQHQLSQKSQLALIESQRLNYQQKSEQASKQIIAQEQKFIDSSKHFIESLQRLFSFEDLTFIDDQITEQGQNLIYANVADNFERWIQCQSEKITQQSRNTEQQSLLNIQLNALNQALAVKQQQLEHVLTNYERVIKYKNELEKQCVVLEQQRFEYIGQDSVHDLREVIANEKMLLIEKVNSKKHNYDQANTTHLNVSGQAAANELQLKQCEIDYKNVYKKWEEALRLSCFDNEDSFVSALLSEEKKLKLQALSEQIKEQKQHAETLIVQTKKQLNLLNEKIALLTRENDEPFDKNIIEATLSTLNQQLKQNQIAQGQLQQQLTFDNEQRKKQADILVTIASHQDTVDDLAYLNGLIGSATGDKFRRFAQGLTLEHLVYLANQQLSRLHARYQLQSQKQDNLALAVIDTWQADSIRDTKTLSGGESFLVSLALALALSDLASAKTSIDSLFLDEGFGTLDNDTLEVALDALDNLNARGKMIGVISHVDTLKERIDVQIKVNKKNGLGFSELDKQFVFCE